jgi:ribonucleoside-diphosphate reductase beta chain
MPSSSDNQRTVQDIVNARRVIMGPSDKLRAVSATRYPWTREVYRDMINNRWEPNQVAMNTDKAGFSRLPKGQQTAYRRALAFLSNLDAIQVDNLSGNIYQFITDPTIQQVVAQQTAEEWIHVEAYSHIVETVLEDPLDIYDMYRHVPQLASKNDFIISQGEQVRVNFSPEAFVKAIVSNVVLEGIYFFSGFLTFYAIARAGGYIIGTVDQIKYIQRDELTHLKLFTNMWHSLRAEMPEVFTPQLIRECREIILDAVEREIAWGHYVIEEGVTGTDKRTMTQFIRSLGNKRAEALGITGVHERDKNPFPWFDEYSNINGSQKNFFEGKPVTYQHNSLVFGPTPLPIPDLRAWAAMGNNGEPYKIPTVSLPVRKDTVAAPATDSADSQ